MKQDRKAILEILQRQGEIEVQDFVKTDAVFKKRPMPISGAEFERNIHDAEAAIEVLNTYNEEKSGMLSSFKGRDIITEEEYNGFKEKYPEVYKTVQRILALSKEVAEKNAEIVKCSQQIDMLAPWEGFDVPLDTNGTDTTSIFIGALPGEWTLENIYKELAQQMPEIDVDIISKSKDQTCVMVVCRKENYAAVNGVLRGIGFAYPAVSCPLTPVEQKAKLEQDIETLKEEVKACEEEIMSYDPQRPDIKFLSDYQAIRAEKYAVTSSLPQSEHTFVISGYTPAKSVPRIEKALEQFDVVIETKDPGKKEKVPVKLQNNGFSSAVQGVVESYALPKKGEIDPCFIISLFYFIFFGFMLADFCIGLLIFLGALVLLLKNKNMEQGLKNNVKLFMFGGIAAMFFGVLFGSYFGDVIPAVSGTFFGHAIVVKPLWLDMTTNPMTVLTLALIMGLIHIFTGMAINGYQLLRKKDIVGFIFDVIFWYIILIGLIIKALSMQMIMDILLSGSAPIFSAQVGNIGMYAAGIACIGIIAMGGRESKNIGKRLLKGVYAVYGITGYLSDLLSYSRLLALGLATGVISSVANMIGTMFGNGVVGVIIYIFVFIIINAINIGINTLGAYVHTNRLQYVEFFGRFYDGGGRPFQPYSIKTKYYKFKENRKK
ncbi:MAG: V-type ATP synthase subunit I [Lachnospiraceae bacterium]|nr:V-type ATP synthase subunit I [Lachnospiraceae bacterium]